MTTGSNSGIFFYMNNELIELEISRVRTLVSKIRDAHCIDLHGRDGEFEVYSPDGFKLSFVLDSKDSGGKRYIVNINDLSDAKIVYNAIIVKAYDDNLDENVTVRIKLFSKIPVEINHLST